MGATGVVPEQQRCKMASKSSVRMASTVALYLNAANVMALAPVVRGVAGWVSSAVAKVKDWYKDQCEYSNESDLIWVKRRELMSRKGPVNDLSHRGDLPIPVATVAPVGAVADCAVLTQRDLVPEAAVVLGDEHLVPVCEGQILAGVVERLLKAEADVERVTKVSAKPKAKTRKPKAKADSVEVVVKAANRSVLSFEDLSYRDLQQMAKANGIKANQKRVVLEQLLGEKLN